jgi:hypothetical protein
MRCTTFLPVNITVALRAAAFALLLAGAGLPLQAFGAATGSTKFIPTFLVYYGGGPALVPADAQRLAKFDLLDFDRFRFNQIGWSAIKAFNPNVQIYLYELGAYDSNFHDGTAQEFLNDIDRYGVPRGHSMGSLNGNHPELFLKDSAGNRLYSTAYSFPNNNRAPGEFVYLMDFGAAAYQSYWLEATKADIVNQPWVADGVFADECNTLDDGENSSTPVSPNPGVLPAAYPNNAAWWPAMNSFAQAITAGLHANTPTPQKLWCNRGQTRFSDGSTAWQRLDASANPPDAVREEGAFAVMWGPTTWAVQFMVEGAESDPNPLQHQWKSQVDTLGVMRNSKVTVLSHTKLAEPLVSSADTCGTDNYNKTVCYWQTLWYSLGSFLISKNNVQRSSYFMFHGGDSDYNKIIWYDEYDKIDLGKALEFYGWQTFSGVRVFSREFEKGYVYVNPIGCPAPDTSCNVASVPLPQPSRQLTHATLNSPPDSIPVVNAISLDSHNAAFLLKTIPTTRFDETDPSVTYTAGWTTDTNAPWSEGSGAYNKTAGAQATFSFTGTSVKWIGARGPWGGIARVFLDGTLVAGSVDTYASTEQYQNGAIMFSATGLAAGSHSLRIEVTGTKNAASTDTIVAVDAFDIIR